MILIKTPAEIKKIRESCRVAAGILRDIEKEIRPGVTTGKLDKTASELIKGCGAAPAFMGYRGYRHATCISLNSEVVHGVPSERVIKEGDIVGFDVGILLNGYYGDAARTFAVRKISDVAQKLIECTKTALEKAVSAAVCGGHLGDISAAIEGSAQDGGFSVVKDLFGHGVGRHLHEDPLIPNYGEQGTGPELKPGMVLAIEPMLNVGGSRIVTLDDGWTVVTYDRSLSAHFEHTVLITKGEAEVLTKI